MKKVFFYITFLLAFSFSTLAQSPDYKAMAEFMIKETSASDATKIIVEHLERSSTVDPLEEIIRWSNDGFPDLRDENNNLRSGVSGMEHVLASSIRYLFSFDPDPNKGDKYLNAIERLKDKNSSVVHYLNQGAFKVLSEQELEKEFSRLIVLPDANERARGLQLGLTLAEKNRNIFLVYTNLARNDTDPQVRNTAMHMLGMIRGKYPVEIMFLALERLVVEKDAHARQIVSILIKQGADRRDSLTLEDVGSLLMPMVNTDDAFVRTTLGTTVAKLTTGDKSLMIYEDKLDDKLFADFINVIQTIEIEQKRKLVKAELVEVWDAWWKPLLPKYSKKFTFQACGDE